MANSNSRHPLTLSPASSIGSPPQSNAGIIMVSLPDTQESLPQDVFLTPPEESLLPSSAAPSGSCGVNVDAPSRGIVKISGGSLVKDSDLGFSGVEAQQKKENSVLGKVEKPKLSEHKLGKVKGLSGVIEKMTCIDKGKKIAKDETVKASGAKKSEMRSGGGSRKEVNVLDVLRALTEGGGDDDVEENLDHLTLLDVAKARGVTFPRPRWWPDGDMFESKD